MGQSIAAGLPAFRNVVQRTATAWPFISADTKLTQSLSAEGVLVPLRQEVQFADQQRIWVRRVMQAGKASLYLRELGAPAEGVLVDLRELIPAADATMPRDGESARDLAAWVQLKLRHEFATLDAFMQAATAARRPA
jgi:hypothetical protein